MTIPLRIVVVEDEPVALEGLCSMIDAIPGCTVVGTAVNGDAAVECIVATTPDVLLLDVHMPDRNGLEVLQALVALPGCQLPRVIFVTAHDRYAVQAFEIDAVDYVLKPVSERRLRAAIERARTALALEASSVDSKPPLPSPDPQLVIHGPRGVERLIISEIDWIESADYYVRIHAGTRTGLVRRSIQEFEQLVSAAGFVRIHRRYLVNSSFIASVRNEGAICTVLLRDGTALPVSRRRRPLVTDLFRSTI